MKRLLTVILIVNLLSSCNKITKEDVTIYDGIILGIKRGEFEPQLDSKGYKKNLFANYTMYSFNKERDGQLYNEYLTDAFTSSKYTKNNMTIYGIQVPVTDTLGEIIEKIMIPFGHFIDVSNNSGKFGGANYLFNNHVPKSFLEELKLQLIKKYGTNYDSTRHIDNRELLFTTNGVRLQEPEFETSKVYNWKTKGLEIELYFGQPSPFINYNIASNSYIQYFNIGRGVFYDPAVGYEGCYMRSHIKYTITETAKKELGTIKSRL